MEENENKEQELEPQDLMEQADVNSDEQTDTDAGQENAAHQAEDEQAVVDASQEGQAEEELAVVDASQEEQAEVELEEAVVVNQDHDDVSEELADVNPVELDQTKVNDLEIDQVEAEEDEVQSLRRSSRKKAILAVLSTFLVIICLLAGVVIGVATYALKELSPVEAAAEPVRFTIAPGSNSAKIAQVLEENGLIRNQEMFGYYLRYKNEGRRFQAGQYEMLPGITLDEIINMLNRGETIQEEMIRFTIPEGYTIVQIADKLSSEGLIDRDVFMESIVQPELFTSEFIKEIPDNPDIVYLLEGYLFPDTYEMKVDSTEVEIIQRLLSELDRKIATLPEGWEEQLTQLDISFHDMLTIASLIEREVVVDSERPIVSGVIQNRLAVPMLLQIDATVLYALGEHQDRVLTKDLEVESPYNTYRALGIPPGPIANPGLQSIMAALYPEDTKYYYYVTKKDGTFEHYFGVTLDDHINNIRKSGEN